MLGHLVSTGHLGASEPDTRHAPAPAFPQSAQTRQKGWFGRLFAQIFPRR